MKQGEVTERRSPARPSVTVEPSLARTEWRMLPKKHDAQRDYLLTIRDREGKLISTDFPPEMIVDGEANLVEVSSAGPASWRVRLDFPREHSVVQIGFTLGEWRVERLRRLHWQLHRLDLMQSNVITNKARIRADGEDELRIYFLLRDSQEFPIYQHQDFDLRLKASSPHARIHGPHDSITGAYYRVVTSAAGKISFDAFVDGERLGRSFEVEAQARHSRTPAGSATDDCLQGLATASGVARDQRAQPAVEYERLGGLLVAEFERIPLPSELEMNRVINQLSSPACTTVQAFDLSREVHGTRVRQLTLRSFQENGRKALNRSLFYQPRP